MTATTLRWLDALVRRLSIKDLDDVSLRKIIRSCEEQIIGANIAFYKKLEILAHTKSLKELSNSQLTKIERYQRESM